MSVACDRPLAQICSAGLGTYSTLFLSVLTSGNRLWLCRTKSTLQGIVSELVNAEWLCGEWVAQKVECVWWVRWALYNSRGESELGAEGVVWCMYLMVDVGSFGVWGQ